MDDTDSDTVKKASKSITIEVPDEADGIEEETYYVIEAEDDFERKDTTKIFNLCLSGDVEKLKILEKSKNFSEKKFRKWISSHDDKYNTPFHYAAKHCHKEMLEHLVENWKLDINELGHNKMTALHFAARYGKLSEEVNFKILR